MTSQQIYAELRSRLDRADYHGRLTLATQLLQDKAWVRDPAGGGGDASTAIDRLEAHCFPDVCGPWFGLATLMELLQKYPEEKQWRAMKNDLKAMVSAMQADRRPKASRAKAQPRPAAVQDKVEAFMRASPAQAVKEYEREVKRAEKVSSKLADLEAENAALKAENAELRKEVSRLKSYVERVKNVAV